MAVALATLVAARRQSSGAVVATACEETLGLQLSVTSRPLKPAHDPLVVTPGPFIWHGGRPSRADAARGPDPRTATRGRISASLVLHAARVNPYVT